MAQLRRAFTGKIFLGDRMTNGVKRNATEMRLHAAVLRGDTQSQNNNWAPGMSERVTLSRNCAIFSLRNILASCEWVSFILSRYIKIKIFFQLVCVHAIYL